MKINKKILNELNGLSIQASVVSNTMILVIELKNILKDIEDSNNWEFCYSYLDECYKIYHKLVYISVKGKTLVELIYNFKEIYESLSDDFKNNK